MLIPPLEPGASEVTIARSGRPTTVSPPLVMRASDSRVAGRFAAAAKLSRNARMPLCRAR